MTVEIEDISSMVNPKDILLHCKYLWTFQEKRSPSPSLRKSKRRRKKMKAMVVENKELLMLMPNKISNKQIKTKMKMPIKEQMMVLKAAKLINSPKQKGQKLLEISYHNQ